MGEIFGVIGWTGGALVMTAFVILGVIGKGRVKLKGDAVIWSAWILGVLYAQAGESFAFAAKFGGGLSEAIQNSRLGAGGQIGAGAVALFLCVILYMASEHKWRAAGIALILPSVFTAAGASLATIVGLSTDLVGMVVA